MDIHRCRFVHYPPSTINALAFSHSHISRNQKTAPPRLAVGRANGDVEIWNPLSGSWLQETIIRGGKDRSVDGLVWIQDPNEVDINGRTIIGKSRLFSIGYTTTVTEWDLEKARPLRQTSGNHGEIWCLAAQPALPPVKKEVNGTSTSQWGGQNLISGCTDGALVLYSTKDEDLQLQRVLVRPSSKKAKIISVIFKDRNIVVAGCTDSTIRIYDTRNGTMLRSMSLGAGPTGGPKEIIIWSVKVLQNGTIVSGDSTGELRIWDGKTYTLMQRVKGHRQDILSLATSYDGSTIFSGGMDRRTVVYKQVGKGKPRWAEVAHRRYHSHDVKTMASLEGRGMSVVVSGGPDASPIALPIGQFGMENQRALPFLPQDPVLVSAPKERLMMSWWDREIHIWRLNKPSHLPTENDDLDGQRTVRNRKLVSKILIKGEANITSASLSTDGGILAVSTATDIKVFQVRARNPEDGDTLKISKVSVPNSFSIGARLVQFSADGKWLCIIRTDNRIDLARISTSGTTSSASSTNTTISIHSRLSKLERIDRKIEKHVVLGGLGTYDRSVMKVTFSSDSRILAVSDLAGYIDTFVLSGEEDLTQPSPNADPDAASSSDSSSESDSDSDNEEDKKPRFIFGQHWTRNPSASTIPKLPSAPVVLSFRPSKAPSRKTLTNGVQPHATRHNPHPISHSLPTSETTEDRLLVITATSEIFEFDILKGGLSSWSRRNPISQFPSEFRQIRDQAKGCIWDITTSKERVWIYGVGWLWMFDLSRDLPPIPIDANATANHQANGVNGTTDGTEERVGRKRKRKRHGKEDASGAGSAIPDEELGTGISRTMQRNIHEEIDEILPIPRSEPEHDDGDEDAMDVDDDSHPLEQLRRGDGNDAKNEGEDGEEKEKEDRGRHYWKTFKYRPVLGMCVIGEGSEENGPEVAIVERPIWEADLPPRYYGDQEWEKSGV